MMSKEAFPKGIDIQKVLEFYFMNCSLEADTDTLAVVAATLANGGINPLTDEQVLQSSTV
jgi:glutaminase